MYKWTFNINQPLIQAQTSPIQVNMTKRTIEQQINEANNRLSRLKARQKKLEARQQMILGTAILSVGKDSADNAQSVLALLNKAKLSDAQARDIAPVMDQLRMTAKGKDANEQR